MLESEGKFYIYSTGGGAKSSPDGLAWTTEPSPPWNLSLLPNNQRIWAPGIIHFNGQYYLYGSMWSDAKASVIVLMTSPTLNPDSPNYNWTDQGVAIDGPSGVSHSVIDAAPVIDTEDNLWVVWGGGYPFPNEADSIFLTRMDNATGLPLTTDPAYDAPDSPGCPLKQGHKDSGGSVIGVNELEWGDDSWPVHGPEVTTSLVPCGSDGDEGGRQSTIRRQRWWRRSRHDFG